MAAAAWTAAERAETSLAVMTTRRSLSRAWGAARQARGAASQEKRHRATFVAGGGPAQRNDLCRPSKGPEGGLRPGRCAHREEVEQARDGDSPHERGEVHVGVLRPSPAVLWHSEHGEPRAPRDVRRGNHPACAGRGHRSGVRAFAGNRRGVQEARGGLEICTWRGKSRLAERAEHVRDWRRLQEPRVAVRKFGGVRFERLQHAREDAEPWMCAQEEHDLRVDGGVRGMNMQGPRAGAAIMGPQPARLRVVARGQAQGGSPTKARLRVPLATSRREGAPAESQSATAVPASERERVVFGLWEKLGGQVRNASSRAPDGGGTRRERRDPPPSLPALR